MPQRPGDTVEVKGNPHEMKVRELPSETSKMAADLRLAGQ